MGRGLTHHHVSEKRNAAFIGKTNISCGLFLKPNSIASSQTIPDESVTFIAVEEEEHQNITSSVVLKKGIEELWVRKRVARFINSLACKEIMVKSDTKLAITRSDNRAAENCTAEVTLEDLSRENPSQTCGRVGRERSAMWRAAQQNSKDTLQYCCGWWNMRGAFVQVREGS